MDKLNWKLNMFKKDLETLCEEYDVTLVIDDEIDYHYDGEDEYPAVVGKDVYVKDNKTEDIIYLNELFKIE